MPPKHGLEYNPEIGKYVRDKVAAGVPIKDIFQGIQHFAWAPASMTTLYKKYGKDIYSTRADITEKIGGRVVDQALNGDVDNPVTWKSQELYLRSHGGWSPKSTEQTQEVGTEEEEAENAVASLMKLLGKDDETDG